MITNAMHRTANFLLIALLLAPMAALHAGAAATKPNILVILADDLGYGDVRCYNADAKVPTPNMDKVAGAGMRFTAAHSPATVCMRSPFFIPIRIL